LSRVNQSASWNDVTVAFLGSDKKAISSIRGSIDRVTGDVEATSMVTDPKTGKTTMSTTRPHRRCWPSRPDLGERWPSRLVATAEEKRLKYSRATSGLSFSAASDCRTNAIYEYTP
jgi:hypothetical protein